MTIYCVYLGSICGAEKDRYVCKLQSLCGEVGSDISNVSRLDPYQIPPNEWKDNVSLWPPVEFGHIYMYLVDTPGEFTKEKLKTYKSLEAYN